MAATGVGLVATIAVGAVAGATIAGATAAASTAQQNNGKVDWETVGICAGVGGAVGALASAAGYGITKAVTAAKTAKELKLAQEQAVKYQKSVNISSQKLQHEFKHANDFGIKGNWNKSNAASYEKAIKGHINNATNIYKSTYRGSDVYVYYNSSTKVGAYVDMVGNYVGGWKLTAEQIAYHISKLVLF